MTLGFALVVETDLGSWCWLERSGESIGGSSLGLNGEMAAILVPDVDCPKGDVNEAWDNKEVGRSSGELVCNCSLSGRKYGALNKVSKARPASETDVEL